MVIKVGGRGGGNLGRPKQSWSKSFSESRVGETKNETLGKYKFTVIICYIHLENDCFKLNLFFSVGNLTRKKNANCSYSHNFFKEGCKKNIYPKKIRHHWRIESDLISQKGRRQMPLRIFFPRDLPARIPIRIKFFQKIKLWDKTEFNVFETRIESRMLLFNIINSNYQCDFLQVIFLRIYYFL